MLCASRRCVAGAVVGVLVACGASGAAAEELRFEIGGGRITLIADDTALGDVLEAWARAGGTQFTGAGPIEAARVSLHLVDVDEARALSLLLRPAAGYLAARRARSDPGASRYEVVRIRAIRVPPRAVVARGRPADFEPGRPRFLPEALPVLSETVQLERLRQLLRPNQTAEEAPPAAPPAAGGGYAPLTTPRPGMVAEPRPPAPAPPAR